MLGSASPALLRQSSESLAGRLEVIETTGFRLAEVGPPALEHHWHRGGLPRSYLARGVRELDMARSVFWATHSGSELDLLLMHGGRRYGIEVKRADAPTRTPSMASALADLGLERLAVVYPGTRRYSLGPRVVAVLVEEIATASWRGLFR